MVLTVESTGRSAQREFKVPRRNREQVYRRFQTGKGFDGARGRSKMSAGEQVAPKSASPNQETPKSPDLNKLRLSPVGVVGNDVTKPPSDPSVVQSISPLQRVETSYNELDKAITNFVDLKKYIDRWERLPFPVTDAKQRLEYASSVVDQKAEQLWKALWALPDTMKTALTDPTAKNKNAPGDWNKPPFLGGGDFSITDVGNGDIVRGVYERGRKPYFMDPPTEVEKPRDVITHKKKNPLYHAILYIQQLQYRLSEEIDNNPSPLMPTVDSLQDKLSSMMNKYILKTAGGEGTTTPTNL
jgi:hypothetical protein